jgi:hypothetical protein
LEGAKCIMRYREYIESRDWLETKQYLSNIEEKECYVCGELKDLATHHLSYSTLGYEDGDELVYLCRKHHTELHFFGSDKSKRRPIETSDDLRRACNKLVSMRSKAGRKIGDDKVSRFSAYLRDKYNLTT